MIMLARAGCNVGPEYHPLQVKVAGSYFSASSGGAAGSSTSRPTQISEQAARVTQWWALFNDPTLNSLIDEALESNLDLRLAQARVREARALRAVATGGEVATVSAPACLFHYTLGNNQPTS